MASLAKRNCDFQSRRNLSVICGVFCLRVKPLAKFSGELLSHVPIFYRGDFIFLGYQSLDITVNGSQIVVIVPRAKLVLKCYLTLEPVLFFSKTRGFRVNFCTRSLHEIGRIYRSREWACEICELSYFWDDCLSCKIPPWINWARIYLLLSILLRKLIHIRNPLIHHSAFFSVRKGNPLVIAS